jgi:pyrroloquinoline quinone biosynthesis protein E
VTSPRPYNLVAELTYRCPLRCAYCSNPLGFRDVPDALDTQAWCRVFREASALGVVHVGLTGGEPSARADLAELVAGAAEAGLYTHLVTAGTPLTAQGLAALRAAGLRSVQLSLQDSRAEDSDFIAGTAVFERKLAFAAWVRAEGLPLTLNVVLHRRNLGRVRELIALARTLDADRLELANTQYHGWALANREALLPSRAQIDEAARAVAAARHEAPRPEIVFVLPDYFSQRPKPCMGGWGQRTLVVSPDGRVLPCHAAASIPGLAFGNVLSQSLAECWRDAPGMNAFRGEAWMPEPCRSCPERVRDFGGCRCQAFALTREAGATDPACELAPHHGLILAARRAAEAAPAETRLVLRGSQPPPGAASDGASRGT